MLFSFVSLSSLPLLVLCQCWIDWESVLVKPATKTWETFCSFFPLSKRDLDYCLVLKHEAQQVLFKGMPVSKENNWWISWPNVVAMVNSNFIPVGFFAGKTELHCLAFPKVWFDFFGFVSFPFTFRIQRVWSFPYLLPFYEIESSKPNLKVTVALSGLLLLPNLPIQVDHSRYCWHTIQKSRDSVSSKENTGCSAVIEWKNDDVYHPLPRPDTAAVGCQSTHYTGDRKANLIRFHCQARQTAFMKMVNATKTVANRNHCAVLQLLTCGLKVIHVQWDPFKGGFLVVSALIVIP